MKYIHRTLEKTLKKYLTIFPVTGLTGPRQSGKSTLLLHLLKSKYTYVSFDDYRSTELFYDDPEKFMSIYSDKVIFDEVQKVPKLFNYIKIAVDNNRNRYGNFILTGSSQFTLMTKITESLAGRIGLLTLLPFQHNEIPPNYRNKAVYSGSYPEIVLRNYSYREEWYDAYIETYLEKDVRNLTQVGDLRDFRRFISLLAANTAQIFNMSKFAGTLGVSVPTIKRWISVLEASYVIFILPPYHKNYGKRITKSPKLYFYDTGLVAFLTGIKNKSLYEQGPMSGSLFENYVVAEIKKKLFHTNTKSELYFYRTNHGVEIDLIIDDPSHRQLIEIKNSATFRPRMLQAVESFITDKDSGHLIYQGKALPFTKNISITNFKDYLSS